MSSPSSTDIPSYLEKRQDRDGVYYIDTRLETWDDPTPRESDLTIKDLREAFIEASKEAFRLMEAKSTKLSEEQIRQREEHDRKSLIMALEIYAKQNNMQPADLKFVEVKERNLIDEYGKGYLHFNFLVKGLDGKDTMFFAEVRYDPIDEKDVYLCTPLGETDIKPSKKLDQALCKGCIYVAKNLIHPNCGGFIAGHKRIAWPKWDSDDEERDDEFISSVRGEVSIYRSTCMQRRM